LSILLVKRFGLTGVALGTLVPSIVMSLGFLQPYVARTMKVGFAEFFSEVLAPALVPGVPMGLVVYFLKQIVDVGSVFSLIATAGVGIAAYAAGYLTIGASSLERQTYRNVVLNAMRYAENRLRR
jgi:hypothetical protein